MGMQSENIMIAKSFPLQRGKELEKGKMMGMQSENILVAAQIAT